jgi:hypothetical protein
MADKIIGGHYKDAEKEDHSTEGIARRASRRVKPSCVR